MKRTNMDKKNIEEKVKIWRRDLTETVVRPFEDRSMRFYRGGGEIIIEVF